MKDLRNIFPLLYDFYIVSKEKSFSNASKNSGIPQPNLSRNIKNLEEELNVVLINRSNKGIDLTLDGENLYKQIDEPFSKLINLDNNINGIVTIGLTRNIADNFFPKYLTLFNQKFPNVKVKILTDNASNLNDYLINHKIDFLIDYLPHINYSEKLDLTIESIGNFETCFACSEKLYNKIFNEIHSIEDLNKYDLVISGSSRRRQMLDEVLQANNYRLTPKIEMPDSKLMVDFVENNEYIGYFIANEIKDSNLIEVKLKEQLPLNYIGIIYPTHVINKIAKEFVKLIIENSKNN